MTRKGKPTTASSATPVRGTIDTGRLKVGTFSESPKSNRVGWIGSQTSKTQPDSRS